MGFGSWALFELLALITFKFSDSKVLTCSWNSWQVLCVLLVYLAENSYSHTFSLFYMHVCACATV